MKDFKLYTQFNFAKCVHLSLLSVPEGNCFSPEGMLNFIRPYLQELQENTIISDYLTLVSLQTIDNQDAGVHILTFTINDPKAFDDTAEITCLECLRDIFPYDPEACFGQAPLIKRITTVFMVTVPFTC